MTTTETVPPPPPDPAATGHRIATDLRDALALTQLELRAARLACQALTTGPDLLPAHVHETALELAGDLRAAQCALVGARCSVDWITGQAGL